MKRNVFYFDHAATTPADKRVLKKMLPYFAEDFGNPSNLYELARNAKNAIADATRIISSAIRCQPNEFIFTGSATESNNLALLGTVRANKHKGNKIIISNVEHKSVLAAADALRTEGFEIAYLKVDRFGMVNPAELAGLIDEKTILVSINCADGETGTLHPIKELGEIIKKYREERKSPLPYFHTDAVQAVQYLDLDVNQLGVDLMTLSGHKIYGPKGIGGLYMRTSVNIAPIMFGGGQQGRIRSGTENVPGIAGFGEAIRIIRENKVKECMRVKKLRDKLEKGILKTIPRVVVNGNPKNRLPNFLNISILDIEGEAMLLHLDEVGIVISTGSACNSMSLQPSYILMSMGLSYEYVHGSLRFTLGRGTTDGAVNYVIKKLPPIVSQLRKISPLRLELDEKKSIAQPKAFIGNQTPHFLR